MLPPLGGGPSAPRAGPCAKVKSLPTPGLQNTRHHIDRHYNVIQYCYTVTLAFDSHFLKGFGSRVKHLPNQ